MPEFKLITQTARRFAFVESSCSTNDTGAAVRDAFGLLNLAFQRIGSAPSGEAMAHFRRSPNGVVMVRLGYPVEADSVVALTAAGLAVGDTFSGQALAGVHVGECRRLNDVYDAMRAEIGALGLAPAEDTWERYVVGNAAHAEAPHVEVLWPVHPCPMQSQAR